VLAIGTRVGAYEITGSIGHGGMGEVYRARDTELDRDVAIKVLPATLGADPDRLARLEQEAKLLAALNHPNIAHVYGIVRDESPTTGRTMALVMELVEGPTLADRIESGPLHVEEALGIAMQILEALGAAHARGIIHRDLKPANIKLRPDGIVKVLDFGIAKALDTRVTNAPSAPALTTPAMTAAGIILGTAAYMAPEQARGKPVDERADIWAFGCLLYEMLTGQPAFGGEDVTVTLARVLERETDIDALNLLVAPAIRQTIALCLQKDPRMRLHHVGDVRLGLEGALNDGSREASRESAAVPARRNGVTIAAVGLAAAVLASGVVWTLKSPPPAPEPTRFVVRTPNDEPLAWVMPLALSADGRNLAFSTGLGGMHELFHLSFDDFEPRLVAGGEGADSIFYFPNGSTIGFSSVGASEIAALDVAGGTPRHVVSSDFLLGGSMATDGTFVFAQDWARPLSILRPGEREPVDLTRIDIAAGEAAHLWPDILPGDRYVLFTIWSGDPSWDNAQIAVADLLTGEHVVVGRGASARFAASGHVVFWRSNALWASAFDMESRTLGSDAVRVVPGVRLYLGNGAGHFALSPTGTLAYVPGGSDMLIETLIVDRTGRELERLGGARATGDPRFSPDGTRVALTLYLGAIFGVGVVDAERGGVVSQIPTQADSAFPLWLDEERIAFLSNPGGGYAEYVARADGSGEAMPLTDQPQGFNQQPATVSSDGSTFVYTRPGTRKAGLWALELGGSAAPQSVLDSPGDDEAPSLSPRGDLIAYQTDEFGRDEVYVRPFPDVESRRYSISTNGGSLPVFSRDGTALFYLTPEGIMEVTVSYESGTPVFGEPALALAMRGIRSFDVAPDVQSFAVERRSLETAAREIRVVINWTDELRELVPE
jgi:hypothetical protein